MEGASVRVDNNPYITAKGVTPAGDLRVEESTLVLPLYGVDQTQIHLPLELQSLQYVHSDGTKRFLTDGKVEGGFFPIATEKPDGVIYIAEGVATGLSVHEATGQPVYCALCGWNLKHVAQVVRLMFPTREIIIAGDDDHSKEGNPGRKYAMEAVAACNGLVVFPTFKTPEGKTDFNDLHVGEGIEEVRRQLEGGGTFPPAQPGHGLVASNFKDFIALELPEQEMLLSPWITNQTLAMLYGQRGFGKTQVALTIALTIAEGGTMFGRWVAEKPRCVLYLDGEMAAVELQERLRAFTAASGGIISHPENLIIITPDLQDGPMPDISSRHGQAMVEAHLNGVDLLIIDNLSTLCQGGEENSSESWKTMDVWLRSLKSKGISVLIIHHAGKGGQQRGTSKKEDALNTVVALKKPSDYEAEQGARMDILFEKTRGFTGDMAKPFCAQLCSGDEGQLFWKVSDYHNEQREKVTELMDAGLSVRAIAEELGLSKSRTHRLMTEIKEA
jgi:putative DNA primase/helicase